MGIALIASKTVTLYVIETVIKYDNTDKLFKSKRRYNDFEWLAT